MARARTADISLTVSGDPEISNELKTFNEGLDKDQPLTGDSLTLLQGAQSRHAEIAQALRSRGYYDARVSATVNGRSVEDWEALDAIERQPESDKTPIKIDVVSGPIYKVGDIEIQGPPDIVGPPSLDRSKLALALDKPADAAVILATGDQVLSQIRDRGYALASVTRKEVVVDHATRKVSVTYVVAAGPPTRMGRVRFEGTDKINIVYLQRRVPFEQGEPYKPAKLDALRDRLTSLGVFNAVRIQEGTALDASGELPIDVSLVDRPSHTLGFGAGYETLRGFSVNGYWLHRNLFGEAESLRLSAEVNHIGQGALLEDFGYSFKVDFRKPDWWVKRQDATINAAAINEIYDAYHRQAMTLAMGLDRVLNPHWRVRAGVYGEVSQIERYGIWGTYQLIGLPLQVNLDQSNSDVDPTRGYRLTLNVTPFADFTQGGNLFAILKLVGTTYVDLTGDGRSVLAGRAAFGAIPGGTSAHIPFDKLFYAGGGGSVRGFAYQSAGPRDAFNNPLGGASLIETSLEFRQRIGSSFGAVAFVDAGSAYTETLPTLSQPLPRLGAGVGLRYYTDFGPVRLDVAVPLNKRESDASFGLYVSIGQAF
jgi:translocation and assembly module TamA